MNFNAYADYELVKGKYDELGVTLDLKTAAFAGSNPWFGEAHENIGDAANFWWEGSVEAGAKGATQEQFFLVLVLVACFSLLL